MHNKFGKLVLKIVAFFTLVFLINYSIAHAEEFPTSANAAYVLDLKTNTVLYNKNGDTPLPPASMSKLMTIYVLFDALKQKKVTLDSAFTVSEKAWRIQGSKMFVPIHEQVKVEDLIRGIIIQSGNDACIVVAEGLSGSEEEFAKLLNKKAKEIGLTNSHFVNASGWPEPNHVMSVKDLAILAKRLIEDFPEYYHYFSEEEFVFNGIKQGNRNPLLYKDKNYSADGLKTGHTEEAGYGLTASAVRDERRVIVVLHGLKNMQERADESRRFMSWAFDSFEAKKLVTKDTVIDELPVPYGTIKTVPVVTEKDVFVTLPRNADITMHAKTILPAYIKAPVKAGEKIGILTVSADNIEPIEIPLLAKNDVEKEGFLEHITTSFELLWQ
ncbi:MAG: D-alanyl-D-alanine carboxypeptidase [Alphaproteobacteria bacterium]|nr:D-alanyl-D-alanine carboxypeptidase [Alphaproteobacteria bacterium]